MNIPDMIARIDWTVVDELHHIPEGRKGSLQEALRVEYAAYRALHRKLGTALTPRAALDQAIFNIRRAFPEFQPRYDAGFFFEASHMSRTLAGDPLAAEIHDMAANGGGVHTHPHRRASNDRESRPELDNGNSAGADSRTAAGRSTAQAIF